MRRNSLAGQIISLVVSLLIASAGIAGYYLLTYKPDAKASVKSPAPAPEVRTEMVFAHVHPLTLAPLTLDISVDGVVTPFRQIEVAAEVAGRVVFKDDACNGGRIVNAEAVLIEIDPRDYENAKQRLARQEDQAVASIDELDVEIRNTQNLIENAEKQTKLEQQELDRLKDLVEEGIVTASTKDRATQTFLAAENSVLQLTNQLSLLESRRRRLESARALVATDLRQAELDLSRTKVVAPVDGVIVEDFVEQDSFVQKGESLFKIQDTSKVEVKCRLKMEDLHWVWRHSGRESLAAEDRRSGYQIPSVPVTISFQLADQPGVRYEWDGVLDRFEGSGIDEATRTVPCRVRVDHPRNAAIATDRIESGDDELPSVGPSALVSGMFVRVSLKIKPPSPLLQIPERAVQPGKTVWVVKNGRLEESKTLDLIEAMKVPRARFPCWIVLLDLMQVPREPLVPCWIVDAAGSGLSPGDHVVVSPLGVLQDGAKVREKFVP